MNAQKSVAPALLRQLLEFDASGVHAVRAHRKPREGKTGPGTGPEAGQPRFPGLHGPWSLGRELRNLDLNEAYFAIYEDRIIASGTTKNQVQKILDEIMPTGKEKHPYIYHYNP